MSRLILVSALLATLALGAAAAPATAAGPDAATNPDAAAGPDAATNPDAALDADLARALEAVPGGVLVDRDTVEWPAIGVTLTVADESARSVGSCSTGYVCAYSGANLSGSRLSFAGCHVWSTAALPSVGSIANARTSGWVVARNSWGATLTSAGYGMSVNTPAGVTSIACAGDGVTF